MSDIKIKQEPDENSEEDVAEPPSFAAALGLHRVGTKLPPKPVPSQPIQVLNARGMPARIRKKNKLFFDDDIINDKPVVKQSPTKRSLLQPKTPTKPLLRSASKSSSKKAKLQESPSKFTLRLRDMGNKTPRSSTKRARPESDDDIEDEVEEEEEEESDDEEDLPLVVDKKSCQKIGFKLRNLLKLPKAHKFVSYEWFYSDIDRPLFEGENDFQICLKESFPMLKTRMLTRAEWNKIRRMMGKPRRCSQAFFEEERYELERKRQKIRLLQTKKSCDISFVKDLPAEIPISLPITTRVTARLRKPQDGLFTGVVEALDTSNYTYRISFDRVAIGPQSVPDYEVVANSPVETISVLSLTQKFRPRGSVPLYVASSLQKPGVPLSASKGDPFLIANNQNPLKSKLPKTGHIGGFPLKLLELIVRARKTHSAKHAKLMRLKEMNSEAEMYKLYGEEFPEDFQRKYASIVIGMEKLNRDMHDYLNQIQVHCKQVVRDTQQAAILTPSYLREKCRQMGEDSLQKNNKNVVTDPKIKSLISNLAMLMWVISNLSNNDDNGQVLHSVDACIDDVKNKLDSDNIEIFQKKVQIHLHHIQLELRQTMGDSEVISNE